MAANETGGSGGKSGRGNTSTPFFDPDDNGPSRVVPRVDHDPHIEQPTQVVQAVIESTGPETVRLPRPNLSTSLNQNLDSGTPEESEVTDGGERLPEEVPLSFLIPVYSYRGPFVPVPVVPVPVVPAPFLVLQDEVFQEEGERPVLQDKIFQEGNERRPE